MLPRSAWMFKCSGQILHPLQSRTRRPGTPISRLAVCAPPIGRLGFPAIGPHPPKFFFAAQARACAGLHFRRAWYDEFETNLAEFSLGGSRNFASCRPNLIYRGV